MGDRIVCVVIDRVELGVVQESPQRIVEVELYSWCRYPLAYNRWLHAQRAQEIDGRAPIPTGRLCPLWDSSWGVECHECKTP